MKSQDIREIKNNIVLKKRLAKLMALHCFRNTQLENLHAGKYPRSETGDFSDVKVISPSGEIPWNELSRFNDREMKVLMIDVVHHCYKFLQMLYDAPHANLVIQELLKEDPLSEWNDPEIGP